MDPQTCHHVRGGPAYGSFFFLKGSSLAPVSMSRVSVTETEYVPYVVVCEGGAFVDDDTPSKGRRCRHRRARHHGRTSRLAVDLYTYDLHRVSKRSTRQCTWWGARSEGGQWMMTHPKGAYADTLTDPHVPVCVVPEPGACSASHELPSRCDAPNTCTVHVVMHSQLRWRARPQRRWTDERLAAATFRTRRRVQRWGKFITFSQHTHNAVADSGRALARLRGRACVPAAEHGAR